MRRRVRLIPVAAALWGAGLAAGCRPGAADRRVLDAWLVCDGCDATLLDSAAAVALRAFHPRPAARYLLDAALGPGDTTARRAYELALGARYGRDSASVGGGPGWPTRGAWVRQASDNLVAGMQIRAAMLLGRIRGRAAAAALDSMAAARLRPDVAAAVAHIRSGLP